MAVAKFLARSENPYNSSTHLAILAGLFVILGHIFPVWLHFKGGKGVATAFGVFLALCPLAALAALGLWIAVVLLDALCISGIHPGRGRAPLPHSLAVAGQVRLRIRRGGLCLLLDRYRETPPEYRAPDAWHGAPLWWVGEDRRVNRITIVGSGSWGTALALSLARRGDHSIALWSHSAAVGTYLPGFPIPPQVKPVTDLTAAVVGADDGQRDPIAVCARNLPPDGAPTGEGAGHRERHQGYRRPDLSAYDAGDRAGFGGRPRRRHPSQRVERPSFAQEVAAGDPTAITIASAESGVATGSKELGARGLRLYTNDDVIGVELGGALKNVIAIAAGIASGLGLGHNSAAAIITRGVAEITRLAVACGGRRETLAGLSGLGDLVLTCTGPLSATAPWVLSWDAAKSSRKFSSACTARLPKVSARPPPLSA